VCVSIALFCCIARKWFKTYVRGTHLSDSTHTHQRKPSGTAAFQMLLVPDLIMPVMYAIKCPQPIPGEFAVLSVPPPAAQPQEHNKNHSGKKFIEKRHFQNGLQELTLQIVRLSVRRSPAVRTLISRSAPFCGSAASMQKSTMRRARQQPTASSLIYSATINTTGETL
jgi:hypothetical protein